METNKPTVGFVSLGCPKNQVDTEVMLAEVAKAGYPITAEESEADIIIVNTCAFIESAKKESIDNILDVAWLKENAHCRGIIVTGCLAQRYGDAVLEELPEVDAILGVGSIGKIVPAIESVERRAKEKNTVAPLVRYRAIDPVESMTLGGDRIVTTPEYEAYLKISEGCNNRCAYCAIPSIRGNLHSRPIEDIVAEAKDMEAIGCRELTLVAQDTTVYGLDLYGEYRLVELIRAICRETAIPWIRLLYCYPDKISDELVEEFRSNDRLLNYIDLPVQHLSDRVLARMNRHGDSAVIRDAVRRLRTVPGMTIRTTFLVGFPGETEEDFRILCEGAKELAFDRVGVFPYSREEGTASYDMEDQVDPQVAQDRADILMREQAERSAAALDRDIGKTVTVLYEGYDKLAEACYGRTYRDAYEIDGKVYFTAPAKKRPEEGTFVKVRITEALDYDLFGELAD